MSHEFGREPSAILLDAQTILDHIGPSLDYCSPQVKDDVLQALNVYENHSPYGVQEIFDAVSVQIDEYGDGAVRRCYPAVSADVASTFPEEYQTESMVTHRQYLRMHGIDPNRRHLLAKARVQVVDTVQAELVEAMDTDADEHQEYATTIEDTLIMDAVNTTVNGLNEQLATATELLTIGVSDEFVRIKMLRQLVLDATKTRSFFESIVLFDAEGTEHKLSQMDVAEPNTATLNRDAMDLAKLITELSKDCSYVARLAAQKLEPVVDEDAAGYMRERFERLAVIAADEILPPRLTKAYAAAASGNYTYVSLSQQEAIMPEVILELEHDVMTDESDAIGEFEVSPIITIPSPFDWDAGKDIRLDLAEAHGQHVVVCEAFGSVAETIRQTIGKERTVKAYLAALRERAVKIELTDPHGRNPHVQRVRGALREEFAGLTVYKFGNIGANAKRVYYVKTNVDRYDDITKVTDEYGLAKNTPLLIFIGDTDKANQLKLFSSFGIERRVARNQGAGSQ